MSSEAVGWVFRYSPYAGPTFAVHVAVADSVNDQYANEFWMILARLAVKARVSRRSAAGAMTTLAAEGFVAPLEDADVARAQQRGRRYRFLFPRVAVVYETRPSAGAAHGLVQDVHMASAGAAHITQEKPNSDLRDICAAELTLVTAPVGGDLIAAVFAEWQQVTGHTRARLDDKRAKTITRALRVYPLADVLDAVRGVVLFAHNMGGTTGKRYDDVTLILRDADHIERFRDAQRGEGQPSQLDRIKASRSVGAMAKVLERRANATGRSSDAVHETRRALPTPGR